MHSEQAFFFRKKSKGSTVSFLSSIKHPKNERKKKKKKKKRKENIMHWMNKSN